MRHLYWVALLGFGLLGCEASSGVTCAYEDERLTLGESRDDLWLCLHCACEEGGLRCFDIEGCVALDEPEVHAHPPPTRDATFARDAARPDARVARDAENAEGPPDAAPDAGEGASIDALPGACEVDPNAETDTDRDSLNERQEASWGTDPCDPDSDDDGQSDGAEVMAGTHPLDPESTHPRFIEWRAEGPLRLTTAWRPALKHADVTFLLDQTRSMRALFEGISQEFVQIARAIAVDLPSPSFGLATFADYPLGAMGRAGDLPFELWVPQTQEVLEITAALEELPLRHGGDGEESFFEAAHQALTGGGYDMRCDQIFDPREDVPPRASHPEDLFDGTAPTQTQGLGKLGGMSYRPGALPIIIYGTDAAMRDPGRGDSSPGGCPIDADQAQVVADARGLGARFIGVMLSPYSGEVQAGALARATGSLDAEGAPSSTRGMRPTQRPWESSSPARSGGSQGGCASSGSG